MYSQDYDDTLPIAAQWNDLTMPYVKNSSVYRCPNEEDDKLPSYGMNGALSQRILASLDNPALCVQLIDSKPGVNKVVGLSEFPFTDRHGDYLIIGFVDGHAKRLNLNEILSQEWEPKSAPKKGNTPWAGKNR
jgi:prepilin-type processing-associated H-X9-DG protein